MKETIIRPFINNGQFLKLEIKQKNINIKKRKVKTWSPEQDDQLVKLYQQYPKKWGIIASFMQDRNQNQCLHRYRRLSQLGAHKKIWSSKQDATILSLIKKIGKNWKLLAQILGTKTGKQIRQRFINKLDPKIKNQQWTDQEDQLILRYYSELGSRWSEISKKLVGRPQNQIKNRFYSYIQKNYDIRYVVVGQGSKQNRQSLLDIDKDIDIKMNENQKQQYIYEQRQKLKRINQYLQRSKDSNEILKQIPLNQKKDKHKILRYKDKIIHRFTRFCDKQNQQNIYQDDQDYGQKDKNISELSIKEILKAEQKIPSIKQLVDEFKIMAGQNKVEIQCMHEQKEQALDSGILINQKYYIKSLIRVQDEIGLGENRDKNSVRDLVSHNEIQSHQNDLFYLLNI